MTGPATFSLPPNFLGVGNKERNARFCIAGVPLDIGTTNRSGARFGPDAIRRASRMLVDGAHPNQWVDPSASMQLADIGNFDIALGDIPTSLELIEKQAESISHLAALGGEHTITLALLRALAKKKALLGLCISTRMSTHGKKISREQMFGGVKGFNCPSLLG
jgi:agmatinase